MKVLAGLVCYLAMAAGLSGIFAGAFLWLIAPDPAAAEKPARPPPIPPRIADSIARKTALVPAPQAEPATPVMKEAAVSLAPSPPPPKFNVRDASPPRKRKPPKQNAPQQEVARAPAAPVATTGRTDNPN